MQRSFCVQSIAMSVFVNSILNLNLLDKGQELSYSRFLDLENASYFRNSYKMHLLLEEISLELLGTSWVRVLFGIADENLYS